ncbi:Ig-like domain-containing protein [Acholeplasma sp. OttesenSCG-928-E16]|nr:Ig-like domain-containing protein [Acholeplasma sp. OttesenSCG-928-E16]
MRKIWTTFSIVAFILMLAACTDNTPKPSLTIDEKTKTLAILETYQLKYTLLNSDQNVVILVSDDSVLKLENDTIQAIKIGTSDVVFKTADEKLSETLKVTVVGRNISISGEETIMVGDSALLTTNLSGDMTWSSSDTKIATVDNEGQVLAVSKGTVTITATSIYNEKATHSIVISELTVDSITVKEKDNEIWLYDSRKLEVEVVPAIANDKVSWSSSNSSVISIDDLGVMTAKSIGKVTISVTSDYDPNKSDSFEIEVVFDPIAVLDTFHIESPFVKSVTSFSEGSTQVQTVYGSVNLYSNMTLNLINKIIPITNTKYEGMKATQELLTRAEADKIVRTGIKHEETKYITYHDTGNATKGANALAHADFMVGDWNANENRARSWHYTVDEERVVYHIPDNEVTWQGDTYASYSSSIGVETCVDFGSDLAVTWHRTAKLMAQLLIKYDLSYDAIVQHYDWNKKNCPQTLRTANLYSHAIDMVVAEHKALTLLKDCQVSFRSLAPDYVDDRGRVIAQPDSALRVSYLVTIKNNKGLNESKVYSSILTGKDNTTTINLNDSQKTSLANFDGLVAAVPFPVTKTSKTAIETAQAAYEALPENVKSIAYTNNYLIKLARDLYALDKVSTKILINEIYCALPGQTNNALGSGFIELYNDSSSNINLLGYKLIIDDKEYEFNKDDVIKANSYYLISTPHYINGGYLPYADKYVNDASFLTNTPNYIKLVDQESNVIDLVGFSSSSSYEKNPIASPFNGIYSYTRTNFLDTNNNEGDFTLLAPCPYNSKNETTKDFSLDEKSAYLLDMEIQSIPEVITLEHKDMLERLQTTYESLDSSISNLVRYHELLEIKLEELDGLLYPEMKVINQVIRQLPSQIVTDFEFPKVDGVSYSFNDNTMNSHFNLLTGELLKMSIETLEAIITVQYLDASKEVTINFGILASGQKSVFASGSTSPSSSTYEQQLAAIGFGGYAIIVGDSVFFIGEKAFISLGSGDSTFLKTELRPYGTSTTIYNQGLIKGVPTATSGGGALYFNTSDNTLSFDISETYGRNNASLYGYGKIIFSPNDNGSYKVNQHLGDSGTNDSTNNILVSLKPGEYLWCPHTYETNINFGTRLHQGGGGITAVGLLTVGISINILEYKYIP